MSYNLIYIEDLDPATIVHELEDQNFVVTSLNPTTFEDTIKKIASSNADAIVLDFRLSTGRAKFDAPTIAQTLRTKSTANHKFIPIFLLSSESVISEYYKDFTSHDLFDISCSKKDLLTQAEEYSEIYKSFIRSYKKIEECNFDTKKILNINDETFENIDYRFHEKISNKKAECDTYAISSFIYRELISVTGLLVDENVVSARLGVSKKSNDWMKLLEYLNSYKYSGIFSDAFELWWSNSIEQWWQTNNESTLRRLNSVQRVDAIKRFTNVEDIEPIAVSQYSVSSNFWSVCKATNIALDPSDGLELHKREIYPWQEREYISIKAAVDGSPLFKYVKPADKKRFTEIAKNL